MSRKIVVDPDLLTTGEAAAILGVTRATMIRWIKRGLIRATVLPSGQHRVRRIDVELARYRRSVP